MGLHEYLTPLIRETCLRDLWCFHITGNSRSQICSGVYREIINVHTDTQISLCLSENEALGAIPQASGSIFFYLEGHFPLYFWNAKPLRCSSATEGADAPLTARHRGPGRWQRRRKRRRGDMSKLTVSWSFPARSLKSLLSVFSRIWRYCTPASLMCPLKTCVDGLSCLLMVLFEVASLTWWREIDERQVFDQEHCCKMAIFDERRPLFSLSNRPRSAFLNLYSVKTVVHSEQLEQADKSRGSLSRLQRLKKKERNQMYIKQRAGSAADIFLLCIIKE